MGGTVAQASRAATHRVAKTAIPPPHRPTSPTSVPSHVPTVRPTCHLPTPPGATSVPPQAGRSVSAKTRYSPQRRMTMFARAHTFTIEGLNPQPVMVEVDIRPGLPAFAIVGLADAAVRESRDR